VVVVCVVAAGHGVGSVSLCGCGVCGGSGSWCGVCELVCDVPRSRDL